jgi:hypothetical protein
MITGLVDTSIVVDLLRGNALAIEWLKGQQQLGISPFAVLELVEGCENKQDQMITLRTIKKFELNEPQMADITWAKTMLTRYWLSHSIDAFDCLIAASAQRMQLPLFTVNLKHFAPLLGSLAIRPY